MICIHILLISFLYELFFSRSQMVSCKSIFYQSFAYTKLNGFKYCYIKVKLVTLVDGKPRALFSKASTPKCGGGCNFFSWIAPLYPWCLPYNAECSARQHHLLFFESFLDLGLNPSFPDDCPTLDTLGPLDGLLLLCKRHNLTSVIC